MYYSNKPLKPTTVCVIVRKNTYGTCIKQVNCRFIGAMFDILQGCARAASHQHERAQKTVFSHLNLATFRKIAKFAKIKCRQNFM